MYVLTLAIIHRSPRVVAQAESIINGVIGRLVECVANVTLINSPVQNVGAINIDVSVRYIWWRITISP